MHSSDPIAEHMGDHLKTASACRGNVGCLQMLYNPLSNGLAAVHAEQVASACTERSLNVPGK